MEVDESIEEGKQRAVDVVDGDLEVDLEAIVLEPVSKRSRRQEEISARS